MFCFSPVPGMERAVVISRVSMVVNLLLYRVRRHRTSYMYAHNNVFKWYIIQVAQSGATAWLPVLVWRLPIGSANTHLHHVARCNSQAVYSSKDDDKNTDYM